MSYKYYLFDHTNDPTFGIIERLTGIQKTYMLNKGVLCQEYFPEICELTLHKRGGDIVTDIIDNIDRIVIISTFAKVIFEEFGVTKEKIEYLPFSLLNKKGKPTSDTPFYIANSLYKIDCADFQRIKENAEEECDEDDPECAFYDGVYYNNNSREKISDFAYLYLKEDLLPEDAVFFRVGECPEYIIIRSDLVEALEKAGMTGLCLKEMGDLS